jgi:hypothetical protein
MSFNKNIKYTKVSVLLCIVLCAVGTFGQKAKQPPKQTGPVYKSYYNYRFEYSVSYPAGILIPQPIAANGDGRKFFSRDDQTLMLVYGRENIQNQTLSDVYDEECSRAGKAVTYKVIKNNWFVVSGYIGEKIFYQKTMYRKDEFMTFSIEYPKEQKNIFDPITAVIAKSFK